MNAAGGDELRDAARRRIAELAAAPATLIAAGTDRTQFDFGDLPLLFDELCKRDDLEALASLGQEFAEVAARQFNRSHDDGDVAALACACMTTVARSLPRWNVSDAEKLLYALDIDLAFPDLWAGEFKLFLDRPWPPAAWASVADELRRRLLARPAAEQRDDDRLQRCLLVRALVRALDSAGQASEATTVCREQVENTGDHAFLVDRLLIAGEFDEATRQAVGGIDAPGPGSGLPVLLRHRLRQIAERQHAWLLVAAYCAEAFIADPDLRSLQALLDASDKAGCRHAVRESVVRFLETGRPPARALPGESVADDTASAWPLPPLPYHKPLEVLSLWKQSGCDAWRKAQRCRAGLELAVMEGASSAARLWYDRLDEARGVDALSRVDGCRLRERVAAIVAADDPERARAIREELAAVLDAINRN